MSLSDCPICWETHCVHQCPPRSPGPDIHLFGSYREGSAGTVEVRKAVLEERQRILRIVEEEATRYSKAKELVSPAAIAAVFSNAVRSKIG